MSARSWEKRNILDGTTKKRSTKRYIAAAKSLCSTQIQIARNCIRELAYISVIAHRFAHFDKLQRQFLATRSPSAAIQDRSRSLEITRVGQPIYRQKIFRRYILTGQFATGGRSLAAFPDNQKIFHSSSINEDVSILPFSNAPPSNAGISQRLLIHFFTV